jgi:hypothetical protein
MGPNGGPAFDLFHLSKDPFSAINDTGLMRSYVYTMHQQGLNANATCEYSTSRPIVFSAEESSSVDFVEYTGSCDSSLGWGDLSVPIRIPKGFFKTLGSWVCESLIDPPAAKRYMIYLALQISEVDPLFSATNTNTGQNLLSITCTIPPLNFGSYDVTFNSSRNQFQVFGEAPPASSPNPNPAGVIEGPFRDYILRSTGQFIPLMQNSFSNMLVESVIASAVKIFESPAAAHDQERLRLYAAMLNGIMEYLVGFSFLTFLTQRGVANTTVVQ